MQVVADFHLHSRYSRAVSKDMVLSTMRDVALQKGLDILTASDWTHTVWFKEIKGQLEEYAEGVYKLKSEIRNSKSETGERDVYFILSTEISSIYSHKGKLRRIHNLVFAPNLETAEKVNKELIRRGCNLGSDGRPIIGISSHDLLSLLLEIDDKIFLIPCHAWTPHFGIYGSASGYDFLEEAFEDLTDYIYGIETGLSSDPEMNWQIPELKNRSILSFSDAHSPAKMGREATVFVRKNEISNSKYSREAGSGSARQISNKPMTYEDIRLAIMRKSPDWKIGYTLEFYPEEGKYHFSGHRNCGVVQGPDEILKSNGMCPVCKKRLTEGVLYRVQTMAGGDYTNKASEKSNSYGLKWYVDQTKNHPPFVKLVPLLEIVAESMHATVSSQRVKDTFSNICKEFGSEIEVLLKTPLDDIKKFAGDKLADGVRLVREGNITIDPGYDGEYGKVAIWKKEVEKKDDTNASPSLFDL